MHSNVRSMLLLAAAICGVMFSGIGEVQSAKQPNFLIIMADDCTYNDLSLYGGQNALTPNIDRLASQGLTFNRAYLSEAMCQPCRAELFTGTHPMRNGCAWNHSASFNTTTSIPQHLGKLGYRVGIAGKVHVKPATAFPFESVGGFDPSCVRNPTRTHRLDDVAGFMNRNDEQPFCLVVALVEPHVPWVMGDASQYPPAEIRLPPNIADTPRTRQDFGKYLAEITYMDGQVGELLETLEKSGQSGETVVLFTSEQGSQFPGCKWTNWDTGLHTALVARWPGRIEADVRTNAIVQYADVLPTMLQLAGEEPDATQFDGSSFSSVLYGEADTHRKYAYGIHNNIPEGPAYPIRTVTDGTYRLIHNLRPDEVYIEKHLMGSKGNGALNNPYWSTWVFQSWEDPKIYELVKRYTRRPEFQLYHTAADPYEMENLAGEAEVRAVESELLAELTRWMEQQGDPGIPEDTHEAHQAARKGEHLYGPGRTNRVQGELKP